MNSTKCLQRRDIFFPNVSHPALNAEVVFAVARSTVATWRKLSLNSCKFFQPPTIRS